MIKRIAGIIAGIQISLVVLGQSSIIPFVKDMQWGIDYQIHFTLSNDSSYSLSINDLYHASSKTDSLSNDFVYYPVMLARDFVDKLNTQKIDERKLTQDQNLSNKPTSLWSALHYSIGGGWIHFLNCLEYSLESKYLDLKAPLMVRPRTDWKPEKASDAYLRTKDWQYYIPYEQKNAKKEYKLRKKEGQLSNLQHIPKPWLELFLKTNQKKYDKMVVQRDFKSVAKIDLVKLMLGANYLGNAQLSYIRTMVQKSILQYSFNRLPSIIVFDDLKVAVVMALDEQGYRIEKIVYQNGGALTDEEKYLKEDHIKKTIRSINLLNQKLFEQKLRKYYQ